MPAAPEPACPRCGYDQTGVVESWKDSCPLEGVCAECGLALEWRVVFDPGSEDLRWFVEHADRVRGFLKRSIPTLACVLLILPFWTKVRPHHRVRPGRAAALVMLGGLAFLALGVVAGDFAQVVLSGYTIGPLPGSVRRQSEAALWMTLQLGRGYRGDAPSDPGLFLLNTFLSDAMTERDYLSATVQSRAWGWAVFFGYPLSLLLLPLTLVRSNIRLRLIVRATIYSAAPFLVMAVIGCAAQLDQLAGALLRIPNTPYAWYGGGCRLLSPEFFDNAAKIGRFGPLWIALWWLAAFTVGWRLRHGVLVWLAVSALVCVLAFGAAGLCSPYF